MEVLNQVSRKEEIIKKATFLFEKKGYSAASMRDLAKEVGIEAGSLYSHFRSKESILRSICFQLASEYLESLKPILGLELPPEDKLTLAIQIHIGVLTKDPKASSVFQQDWKHLGDPALKEFVKMRESYEKGFRKIIRDGIRSGDFEIKDVDFVVLTIFSSINWTSQWYRENGKLKPDQIAKMLSNILIKGISKSK